MDTLPICEAKSKQSGNRCKNYATKGKCVCRFHGGHSTGARTQEGWKRQKASNVKCGRWTKEAIEERREVRKLIRKSMLLIDC
jgi:hypothetical protein